LVHFIYPSEISIGNTYFKKIIKEREIFMKDTYMQKKEEVVRNWYVIDAEGQNLGRVATKVAHVLRGKNKPTYTPHIDCGDYVIVVNASKVNLTGNKLDDKIYYNHSGYTGGLRERTARTMRDNYPVEMMERAVKGMLPKGRLGRQMYKKLFVYAGSEHPHTAQQPAELKLK
jgi:large subunit ribosomal protein L13